MFKKSIASVVAISLLLIVVIFSAIGFHNWYNAYSSNLMVNVETKNNLDSVIIVEGVFSDTLYLKNGGGNSFTSFKIVDENGNLKCELRDNVESSLQADTRLLLTFDDGTATDLSGYNNDGVLNGDIDCSVEGISGKACSFDGVDDYVDILNNLQFNTSKSYSWSLWFNSNNNNLHALMSKQNNFMGSGGGPTIYLQSNVAFYIRNETQYVLLGNVETSNWYHLVIGYNSILNLATLYVNGILVDDLKILNANNSPDVKLTIGKLSYSNSRYFNGTIDEVAIYSKALTDSEVKALYNAKKSKFYEHLISEDIKGINISNCHLNRGKTYKFVGFTNNYIVEKSFISK